METHFTSLCNNEAELSHVLFGVSNMADSGSNDIQMAALCCLVVEQDQFLCFPEHKNGSLVS